MIVACLTFSPTLPFFEVTFLLEKCLPVFFQCCGAESREAEIKLPPGAEIKICGSGSFLFITDLKECYREKIRVPEEVFANYYNFNPNR